MPTYSPKASEIHRAWYVIDAEGIVLGRLATEVASVLRGKHKPTYTPHLDTGDHVIVVNADKIVLTRRQGRRTSPSTATRGYPGGLRSETYATCLARKPAERVASHHPGHGPQEPPRPRPAQQAQDLRRPGPPARRPEAPSRSNSTPGPRARTAARS